MYHYLQLILRMTHFIIRKGREGQNASRPHKKKLNKIRKHSIEHSVFRNSRTTQRRRPFNCSLKLETHRVKYSDH